MIYIFHKISVLLPLTLMTVSLDTFSVGLIDLIKKKQKIKKFTMCKDKSFRARKNKR